MQFIRIQHTDCIVKCCEELLCGLSFYCIRSYIINFGLNVLQRCQEMLDIFQKGAKIQLHAATDEICSACPNNEKGCCSSFSLVEAYDNAVLELCGLENGQIIEFDDFTELVQKEILASGKRKEICGNCQWNSICESQKSRWEKC